MVVATKIVIINYTSKFILIFLRDTTYQGDVDVKNNAIHDPSTRDCSIFVKITEGVALTSIKAKKITTISRSDFLFSLFQYDFNTDVFFY